MIETVVALGVFVIFVIGIYGSIRLSFSLVYQSRIRIVGTALLNEQIEIIRNVAFDDVGIQKGSPSGIFEHVTSTMRNGMTFEITRTIRNIDDPYDGTIGGTPADTAPGDYKFVQLEVQCISCGQRESLSMYTYVAPKYLEGNLNHGALFIHVIDAYGNAVPEAVVHIASTSTNPTYDFSDTTDNQGYLRIYDLATGTAKFLIEATKEGYTTDKTRMASSTNINPITPFVTILKQAVSNLTLTIDHTSSLEIQTQNAQCNAVSGVPVVVKGTRLIGANPDVFLINSTYTTNATGTTGGITLPWDSYSITTTAYDLIGTIPDVPISLLPGSSQNTKLILGPNTARSLIVAAKYQNSPIANATVTITGPNGFSDNKTTGVGSISQTDWSQGPGIEAFGNGNGYSSASGIDPYTSPGNISLSRNGNQYVSSGYLDSSTIDVGENARYIVWSWNPISQPASTTLRIQIATTASSTGQVWNFVGPDGTANTYFNESNVTIPVDHDNERYMRYRVYLDTNDQNVSPILSYMSFVYTNVCTPPGQVYEGGLATGQYTVHIDAAGFQAYENQITVTGDHYMIANLTAL